MSPPVFVVPPERLRGADDRVELDGPEGRHAAVVRRVRAGEQVDLTDGEGLLVRCEVVSNGRGGLVCVLGARTHVAQPQPRLVVVQALPKGARGELAVELMTEVGVDEIVPWQAERCVTRWGGERGTRALHRWRSTAREAGKQSRRAWFCRVSELASTAQVAQRLAGAALPVVLHEVGRVPVVALAAPATGEVVIVVGPEGGISDEELACLVAAGGAPVRLGPTVLRTSSAGTVAAAALLARTRRWS